MLTFIVCLLEIFGGDSTHTRLSKDTTIITSPSNTQDNSSTLATIRRIIVTGNHVTKERFILRELTHREGDTVRRSELEPILAMDRKKLANTRLFNHVEIKANEFSNNEVDLRIEVFERWYVFPSPIFKLSDRNLNEWWDTYHHDLSRVMYGAKVVHSNMRGRGERLGLWLQCGFQREFEVKYRFPYIDKKQIQGLTVQAFFSEAKNLSYRTEDHKLLFHSSRDVLKTTRAAAITYSYRKSFYNSHSARFDFQNSNVCDSVTAFNPNYYLKKSTRQRFAALRYGFESDHRDYVGYPTEGYRLIFEIQQSGLTSSCDLDKLDVSGSLTSYHPLGRNFFFSSFLWGHISTQNSIPYSNYEKVGYRSQVLRGFEVFVIEGAASLLNKSTMKKLLFSRKYRCDFLGLRQLSHFPLGLYLKAFADAGYVKNYPGYELNSRLTNKTLYSYGGGLDIVGFYDIVIRLEYALTSKGRDGLCVNINKEF